MPTALVTGGAGFLGSQLVDALLARGLRVIVLDDLSTGSLDNLRHLEDEPRLRFVEHDVQTPFPDGLRSVEFDCIFNLASPASPRHYQAQPVRTLLTNVLGTKHGLELALHTKARFFQASTSEVYGEPSQHPQHETDLGRVDAGNARACYAEGKRAAETLCFDFAREHGVDVRVARLFNTYGPRMALDDGRVVSNFLVQALRGEPLTIHGDGQQTRSFCYVTDLVEGMLAFAQRDLRTHGPINLGNPEELSVLDLATRVLRLVGSPSTLTHHAATAGDPRMRRPDFDRARELFGFAPATSLDLGLRLTLEDLRPRTTQRDAA